MTLESRVRTFAVDNNFRGRKGPLSVALVVTQHARAGLPLLKENLLTGRGGQVLGLGVAGVQAVLNRHGITKVLAREGGRTSRGSIENMESYVDWLNAECSAPDFDIDEIERIWVDLVREHFASQPFILRLDTALSLRAVLSAVISQAEARQREAHGSTIVGTMLQHMVGAKLDLVLGVGAVVHHSANQNDVGSGRGGDFDVGDVAIHVTAAPSEALIRKCLDNLSSGKKPLIVTGNVVAAQQLAENAEAQNRIEFIDFTQFIATNLHEWSLFEAVGRATKVADLIDRYNGIIDAHETDSSLKIQIA